MMEKIKSGVYSFTEKIVQKTEIPKSKIDGERRNDLLKIRSRLVATPQMAIRRDFELSSQAGSYVGSLNTIIRRTKINTIASCRRGKTVFIFQK